jgi:hypothetical protein
MRDALLQLHHELYEINERTKEARDFGEALVGLTEVTYELIAELSPTGSLPNNGESDRVTALAEDLTKAMYAQFTAIKALKAEMVAAARALNEAQARANHRDHTR